MDLRYITLDGGSTFLRWGFGSGGTVEIVNLEVAPSERRRGKGRRLVEGLIAEMKGGTHLIFAITAADNDVAQAFYAAVGFRLIARLPRFYTGGDAFMFGLDLPREGACEPSR